MKLFLYYILVSYSPRLISYINLFEYMLQINVVRLLLILCLLFSPSEKEMLYALINVGVFWYLVLTWSQLSHRAGKWKIRGWGVNELLMPCSAQYMAYVSCWWPSLTIPVSRCNIKIIAQCPPPSFFPQYEMLPFLDTTQYLHLAIRSPKQLLSGAKWL